jgi:hypothetical protein
MSNAVFPTLAGISWGIVKAPQWNTRVQRSISFMETRIAFASLPQWRWSVPFQFLRVADPFEYQTLASFYNDRKGRWDSFLYSDPVDSSVTDMNFGTGDGSTTQFQLGRRLLAGGLLEPIYNVQVLTNIKKNGVLQTSPANYSISATGLVTFTAPRRTVCSPSLGPGPTTGACGSTRMPPTSLNSRTASGRWENSPLCR